MTPPTPTPERAPAKTRLRLRARWRRPGPDELPGWPPPVESWTTRAEFLRDYVPAMKALHSADMSSRAAGGTALLMFAALVCSLFAAAPYLPAEDGNEVTGALAVFLTCVFGIPAPFLYWKSLRRTLDAREINRRVRAWRPLEEDPLIRALPPGEVDSDLRQPFDARHDGDFDQYAGYFHMHLRYAPMETGALLRGGLCGLGLVASPILCLLGISELGALTPGAVFAGVVIGFATIAQMRKTGNFSWGETKRWWRMGKEIAQWDAERAVNVRPS